MNAENGPETGGRKSVAGTPPSRLRSECGGPPRSRTPSQTLASRKATRATPETSDRIPASERPLGIRAMKPVAALEVNAFARVISSPACRTRPQPRRLARIWSPARTVTWAGACWSGSRASPARGAHCARWCARARPPRRWSASPPAFAPKCWWSTHRPGRPGRAAEGCAGTVHLVGILRETRGTATRRPTRNHLALAAGLARRPAPDRVPEHPRLAPGDDGCPPQGRAEQILLAGAVPLVLRVPMIGASDFVARAGAGGARPLRPLLRGEAGASSRSTARTWSRPSRGRLARRRRQPRDRLAGLVASRRAAGAQRAAMGAARSRCPYRWRGVCFWPKLLKIPARARWACSTTTTVDPKPACDARIQLTPLGETLLRCLGPDRRGMSKTTAPARPRRGPCCGRCCRGSSPCCVLASST